MTTWARYGGLNNSHGEACDFGMKYLYIDFEYNQPVEDHMGLVSASYLFDGEIISYWLYNDPAAKAELKEDLFSKRKGGPEEVVIVGYATDAEAQCFHALGLNPLDFDWIDLYSDHRQLQNCDYRYEYGDYISDLGFPKKSRPIIKPPRFLTDEEWEEYKKSELKLLNRSGFTNEKITPSLVNSLYSLCGIRADSSQKDAMRDLILERKSDYTKEERRAIMEYCESDVKHLPTLDSTIQKELEKVLNRHSKKDVHRFRLFRGRVVAGFAVIERNGIPINRSRFKNLCHNVPHIKKYLMHEFNTVTWPIYHMKTISKPVFKFTEYQQKYNEVERMIQSLEVGEDWPVSKKSGNLKLDDDTLKSFEDVPEILKYRKLKSMLSALGQYTDREEEIEKKRRKGTVIHDHIDSRWLLHPRLGAFGTQTARNGHKASTYVFAQSAWLRCIIDPPPGHVIVEMDWSSQEVLIGACLSGDEALLRAYEYADPYLAFGFEIGYIPETERNTDPAKLREKYGPTRKLLKVVVLGLSYGMRSRSLAAKMQLELGRPVDPEEAQQFIDLHEKAYPRYYAWREAVWEQYQYYPLVLRNGWYIGQDNPSRLSVMNAPVQATGSAMLHLAVLRGLSKGIHLIGTVHDSAIFLSSEEEHERDISTMTEIMLGASKSVLNNDLMRVDHELIRHGEYWITDKVTDKHRGLIEFTKKKIDSFEEVAI